VGSASMNCQRKGTFLCCRAPIPVLRRNREPDHHQHPPRWVPGKDGDQWFAHLLGVQHTRSSSSPIHWPKDAALEEITVHRESVPAWCNTSMWDLLAEEWRNDNETRAVPGTTGCWPSFSAKGPSPIGSRRHWDPRIVTSRSARIYRFQAINLDGRPERRN